MGYNPDVMAEDPSGSSAIDRNRSRFIIDAKSRETSEARCLHNFTIEYEMNEISAINARLGRLERERNHWRLAGIVMLTVGALALFAGSSSREQAPADVVRAEQFIVVDAKGRTMAQIGVSKDGTPVMDFNDPTGKRRIVFGFTNQTMPSISLLDTEGRERLALKLHPEMGPSIAFLGPDRDMRALLGTMGDGSPALGFLDKEGNNMITLGVDRDGSGELRFRDRNGKVLFEAPARP